MKPLAIIPARKGSRRLPDKNQKIVGGMPLVERAILMGSAVCGDGRVVVTHDYGEELLEPTFKCPTTLFERFRPEELCTDTASSMDVVRDALEWLRDFGAKANDYDAIILLQPTSPLRTQEDVAGVLALLDGGAEAAISVSEAPFPELYTLGHAGRMRAIGGTVQRDVVDGRRLVRPNGAVYAIRRDVFEAGFDWWTASVVEGYVMPPERSVDIDTIYDLEEARRLWNQRQL